MNQTRSDQLGSKRPVSDSDVLAAVTKMLKAQARTMGDAVDHAKLKLSRPSANETRERAYWHAGYVVALQDVLRMIERRPPEWPEDVPGVGRADY